MRSRSSIKPKIMTELKLTKTEKAKKHYSCFYCGKQLSETDGFRENKDGIACSPECYELFYETYNNYINSGECL